MLSAMRRLLFFQLLVAVAIAPLALGHSAQPLSRKELSRRQVETAKRHTEARRCASTINAFHAQRKAKRSQVPLNLDDLSGSSKTEHSVIQNHTCLTAPEIEEGPYYVNNEQIRQDLRENQQGVTLVLDIGVIDTNTCEPLSDALIEIWSANATGFYGSFENATLGGPPGRRPDSPGRKPDPPWRKPGRGGQKKPNHPWKKPKPPHRPESPHHPELPRHSAPPRRPAPPYRPPYDDSGSDNENYEFIDPISFEGDIIQSEQGDTDVEPDFDIETEDLDLESDEGLEIDFDGFNDFDQDSYDDDDYELEFDYLDDQDEDDYEADINIDSDSDHHHCHHHPHPKPPHKKIPKKGPKKDVPHRPSPDGPPRGGPSMTSNNTWLRGGYPTNESGIAELTTIYPGFYAGRTVHIHMMVHTNYTKAENGTIISHSGNLTHVGQLFFDESWNDIVLKSEHYLGNLFHRTPNAGDMDFGKANADGNNAVIEVEMLGDNISDGLLGFITIGVNASASYEIHSKNYHDDSD